MEPQHHSEPPHQHQPERHEVDIEGVKHHWHVDKITIVELRQLAGWEESVEIIEIDVDNNERVVLVDEVIVLTHGHSYGKRVRWKRGDTLFDVRLNEELRLISSRFPNTRREGVWFLLPDVAITSPGWNRGKTDVVLRVQPGYPATPPYAFFVPRGIRFEGNVPDNYQEPTGETIPFPGEWGVFSWLAEDGHWRPLATASAGSNLLNFAVGVTSRFQQGK